MKDDKDNVVFWDHAENARLYQEELDKNVKINKARDIYIAHSITILKQNAHNIQDVADVIASYERYMKAKNDER